MIIYICILCCSQQKKDSNRHIRNSRGKGKLFRLWGLRLIWMCICVWSREHIKHIEYTHRTFLISLNDFISGVGTASTVFPFCFHISPAIRASPHWANGFYFAPSTKDGNKQTSARRRRKNLFGIFFTFYLNGIVMASYSTSFEFSLILTHFLAPNAVKVFLVVRCCTMGNSALCPHLSPNLLYQSSGASSERDCCDYANDLRKMKFSVCAQLLAMMANKNEISESRAATLYLLLYNIER